MGNNTDRAFTGLRPGTSSRYLYARLNAERITRLPYDFSWIIRAQGQLADHKLLPSEELGLGGHATVRGFDERLVNGDDGWLISNELRTPSLRLGNLLATPNGADFLQFLAFFDYGATRNRFPRSGDNPPEADLASVGGGLRFTVSQNFALRFDYGYQLADHSVSFASGSPRTSRVHVSVLLSY
jgi:hemolysin activation/secretion protein